RGVAAVCVAPRNVERAERRVGGEEDAARLDRVAERDRAAFLPDVAHLQRASQIVRVAEDRQRAHPVQEHGPRAADIRAFELLRTQTRDFEKSAEPEIAEK